MNEAKQYRKKPVVIEAIQLNNVNFAAVCDFIGEANLTDGTSQDENYIGINTLEGEVGAREGDWVIKGVKGEFYPCKPDIFEATYEPVKEEA